jgi:hypothetical protein
MLTGPKKTIQRARKQRQEMSLPEVLLWQVLRGSPEGIRFRRLQPSGQLVSDFFCHKAGLVVELDGETHSQGDQPAFGCCRMVLSWNGSPRRMFSGIWIRFTASSLPKRTN